MVKPEDEGLYTCIAGNFLGQAEASAYLEVNSANTKFSHSTPMTLAAAAALIFTLFTQVCSKTLPFASRRGKRKTVDLKKNTLKVQFLPCSNNLERPLSALVFVPQDIEHTWVFP